MKKFLLCMLTLLMSVSGAWAADNLPASTWNISSALPTDNWEAMGNAKPSDVGNYTAYYRTQEITLETAGMIDINFLYSSGNHRLEILGVDALNGSNEVVASDYHFGYTGGQKSLNDYLLNGLSAGTYTLRYIINSGVSSSVGNITIRKFEADVVASLPQLTTDVNNPKYYSIGSYNRGGYLTSNGAGQAMTHVDFAAGSSWYFTAINGNNSGTVIGGVIAHCSDGTQMKQNWQTAVSGETVYILPNGVNTNGFSISKTLPISGSSCCDANNTNTGVGSWSPSSNDWQGTTWVFVNIPNGYYYFKGMATDRHPYLYSDFVGKSTTATYHHDLPATPSNGHIWKVTNGTTFTATNGEGLPLTIGSNTYETLTIGSIKVGPEIYFTEAINLTNWGNDTKLTTWADHPDATDNKWTFELADISAGVYDVVVQGNDDGYVTYSGQNAKNGGFFVAASIAEGDLTAKAIGGYTTSISISGRTITVSYNKQISYTLIDANGATYSWSASGAYGVAPAIEGCDGYSLSNEVWNEGSYSYTADITFPFPVSPNGTDNYTFIGQFNNKSGYSAPEFLWHANGTSINIHSGDLPTTEDSDHDKFLWSIIPAFSNGAFTFTIQNKSTGTYVNSTCTENRHNVGDVTLSATATPMTYKAAGSTGTCNPINAWYLPSTSKYLSANSVTNGENAVLGVWGSVHDGISTGFPTYGDLSSIYWRFNDIAAKIANAGQYGYPAASETNTAYLLWAKGAMARGQFDGTKENYNNLRTWYEGFLTTTEVVTPADGTFLRIRSILGANACLKAANAGTRMTFTTTDDDAETIFLFKDSKLVSYSKGIAINNVREIGTIGGASSTVTFVKAVNGKLGQLSVTATYANNTNYLYSTGVNGSNADRNTYSASFVNQNSFTLEEVTELPVSISGAGYATYCFPVNVTFNGNGNANSYVATSASNNSIHFDEVEAFSAGQGILLKGTEGSYTFTVGGTGNGQTDLLGGTTAAVTVESLNVQPGSTLCAFQKSGSDYGFFKYPSGQETFPGFKAYYIYTPTPGSSSNFFTLSFDDDDVTAVDAIIVNGQSSMVNGYYDLQGRKVVAPQKGQLYIHNGKKVLY